MCEMRSPESWLPEIVRDMPGRAYIMCAVTKERSPALAPGPQVVLSLLFYHYERGPTVLRTNKREGGAIHTFKCKFPTGPTN